MRIIKLKVLEREWIKLWLRDIERNPHSKIELKIVYDILQKLKWLVFLNVLITQ